jgi:hypothetical protein
MLIKTKFYSSILLLSTIIFANLNCAVDTTPPEEADIQLLKAEKAKTEKAELVFKKINIFEESAQKEDQKFLSWVKRSKNLLGIDSSAEEAKEKEVSTFENISNPLIENGAQVNSTMKWVCTGAKVLGYAGVPGAALIGDLSYYNNLLGTGMTVLKSLQPSAIQAAYEKFMGYKNATVGMSDSDKEKALTQLASFTALLKEAQERSEEATKLNKTLEALFNEGKSLSDPNSSMSTLVSSTIVLFSKNRLLEQSADIEILSKMSTSLLLTAEQITKSLEPYKTEGNISRALDEMRQLTKFVNGLPALSADLNKRIKENFHENSGVKA